MDFLKLRDAMPKGELNIPDAAFNRWNPALMAAEDEDVATISIMDIIGQDFWGEGVTAKRIAGALRSIGDDNPVVVNMNSPGGDMFEGIAIHNLLDQHKGKVTVRVLGMAASAASVVAMAGDEILMAKSSFLMIHNAWMGGVGNRHDFRELADWLEPFDNAMRDLYAEKTATDPDVIAKMLDGETWLGSNAAIEAGFADAVLSSEPEIDETEDEVSSLAALRKIDKAMSQAGVTRKDRRELLKIVKSSTPSAARDPGTQNAVEVGEAKLIVDQMKDIFK